jgi:hypothetical protein
MVPEPLEIRPRTRLIYLLAKLARTPYVKGDTGSKDDHLR